MRASGSIRSCNECSSASPTVHTFRAPRMGRARWLRTQKEKKGKKNSTRVNESQSARHFRLFNHCLSGVVIKFVPRLRHGHIIHLAVYSIANLKRSGRGWGAALCVPRTLASIYGCKTGRTWIAACPPAVSPTRATFSETVIPRVTYAQSLFS
jgi:hypothetical protein